MHTTIRKVRVENGTGGYRRVNDAQWERLPMHAVRFDGVDGDEESNTVTYYYTKGARPE